MPIENISLLEFLALTAVSYLLIISIISFIAFAGDKKRSERGDWRIPEKHLLVLAALGGSIVMFFARRWLRHKTYKQPFLNYLRLIFFAQIFGLCLVGYWLLI